MFDETISETIRGLDFEIHRKHIIHLVKSLLLPSYYFYLLSHSYIILLYQR